MKPKLFNTLLYALIMLACAISPGKGTMHQASETSVLTIANTAYFVDPVNGDDERSGTSPQDAWRTLRNVYSYRTDYTPPYAISLKPGDTIYLMDGVHSTIYRPGDDSGAANGRLCWIGHTRPGLLAIDHNQNGAIIRGNSCA